MGLGRLLLIEPATSPFFARIAQAAREMQLSVERVDRAERAPDTTVVGIGPSMRDPLGVARDLRQLGGQALLVFFTASDVARDTLQAELIRDPFIVERYELIEITEDRRQLAQRIGQAGARVERTRRTDTAPRRITPRSRVARRRHGRAAIGGEQYLASILAQASEAIVSTDLRGTILTWNAAAERLFGVPAAQALGKPLTWLDANQSRPECQLAPLAQQVLASGEPEQANLPCGRVDGETVELALSLAPIRGSTGHMLGLSLIARDDSEHRRAEAALREINRQKDEFLAIMSHELRTPLTSILGYADLLLRGLSGPLPPRANRYVTNVRAAGDRLLELVNGLLDFTRLEAGAERIEMAPVDLRELVLHGSERCRGTAESKQIELQVAVDDNLLQVEGDDDRLQHVLRSYLGNALKFTPDGGRVRVELRRDPQHEDRARVSVSDSGIGMQDEQIMRVWERFYQADASLTRPYGGMGLGLSIARHLVLLHGGEVGAESEGPGRGSTFWFSLPLAPEPASAPRHTTRTAPPRAGTRN